jgi:hypothetical protein
MSCLNMVVFNADITFFATTVSVLVTAVANPLFFVFNSFVSTQLSTVNKPIQLRETESTTNAPNADQMTHTTQLNAAELIEDSQLRATHQLSGDR